MKKKNNYCLENRKSKKNKKRNNQGFSLVELIIAVTILAIAMIPMIRIFIAGANTNAKAKKRLMATSVAQDVMEGLEATNLKELAYQANYPSLGLDVVNLGMNVTAHEMVKSPSGVFQKAELASTDNGGIVSGGGLELEDPGESTSVTSSIVSYDHGNSFYFKENPTGSYYFSIENMRLKRGYYDALITLTSSSALDYSEMDVPQIADLNTDYDAFYMEDKANFDTMISRIKTIYSDTIKKEDITRTITLDVSKKTRPDGKEYTQATILYQYTFVYNGTEITYPSTEEADRTLLYDNSEDTDLYLRNLYLFYLPHYASTQMGAEKDRIIIQNKSNVKFTLNLIKQRNTEDTNLQAHEFNYKAFVGVEENTLHGKGYLNIKTNLDKNLASESVSQPTQVTYEYNGDLVQQSVKNKIAINSLTRSEKKVKLYNVTVEVYKAGAANKGYKDCDVLATLTGGMND